MPLQYFIKLNLKSRREFLAGFSKYCLNLNFTTHHKSVLVGEEYESSVVCPLWLILLELPSKWLWYFIGIHISIDGAFVSYITWTPQKFYCSFKSQFQRHLGRIFVKGYELHKRFPIVIWCQNGDSQSLVPTRAARASLGSLLIMKTGRPQNFGIRILEGGPSRQCLNKTPRWYWCKLRFKNQRFQEGIEVLGM